ncbi:hypothetical protein LXL04_002498 [Taraxacum kok-saghyz]
MEDHRSIDRGMSYMNAKRLDHLLPEEACEKVFAMPRVSTTADVCSVCMESFNSSSSCKEALCGHVYHDACITKWLSFYNSCPLCRCKVVPNHQKSCSGGSSY